MATQNMQAMQLLAPDISQEQNQLSRRQAIADLLRKQSLESSGGTESIGGWAIKKSPFEALGKMAQALGANYVQNDVNQSQTELNKSSNKRLSDTLTGYQSDLHGTPAQSYPVGDDEFGAQTVDAPAIAPNRQAALARLLGSGNATLQQMGMQQMLAKPENPFGKVDAKDYTAASIGKFASTQNFADLVPVRKQEFVNTGGSHVAVNPYDTAPGTAIQNTGNPFNDLLVGSANGPVPNLPLIQARKDIAKEGAPKTNVQNTVGIAAPENEYNKTIGKGLADSGLTLIDTAKAAPETIRNAQMIREALDKGAITGTGAGLRLSVQKAMETAGLVGEGKAADTQALMSGLSKITLSGIKTSGLGAGNGFTNQDRVFLEGAISGTIDSTPSNLRRVADLSERVGRANHQKGSAVLNRWKANPALGAVAQDSVIDAIPVEKQNLSPTKANAAKFLGFEK